MRDVVISIFFVGFVLSLTVGLFTVSPAFSIAWMCFVITLYLIIRRMNNGS